MSGGRSAHGRTLTNSSRLPRGSWIPPESCGAIANPLILLVSRETSANRERLVVPCTLDPRKERCVREGSQPYRLPVLPHRGKLGQQG